MFASSTGSRAKRRGIVLVVVLGMLGLMALIGVTFATFAGQSLIASRNFGQGVARPQAEALMDFALAQLINDTNNPVSAIRGHSLLRDMYGNDSVYRGANPLSNPASETGGLLSSVYVAGQGSSPLVFTNYQPQTNNANTGSTTAFYNQWQYQTNISTGGQYYGLDFTRWLVRFPINGVPQTFEILEDDASGAVHLFTLASNLINPTLDPTVIVGGNPTLTSGDWTPFIYHDPNLGAAVVANAGMTNVSKAYTSLAKEINVSLGGLSPANPSAAFVLDGRYMRAFNGAGMTQVAGRIVNNTPIDVYPYNFAAYGNFRLSGLDPDALVGMDEDYDACDLENWFLAIQSADGQVVIPSFHRPGILMAGDWIANAKNSPATWAQQAAKILRPRQGDHSPLFPADPSAPDPLTGKLTYDIDNDGDGITDSVWVDLGYPVQRDPGGKLFKPLFAFMVLGLNGRLPLNSAGNLQARATGDQTNTSGSGQGGGPSVINTNMNGSATTQVTQPGPYTSPSVAPDSSYFNSQLTSQVYLDSPLWDHTSHLGYSVNEINPKFALQNAPSNLYPAGNQSAYGVFLPYNASLAESTGLFYTPAYYTQRDNVGLDVSLTQLRNILAGTVPTDIKNLTFASLTNNGYYNQNLLTNSDLNVVVVNGQPMILPNNVADPGDYGTTGVSRLLTTVPGRWGEPSGVPKFLPSVFTQSASPYFGPPIIYPGMWYNNPVRAGRSYFNGGTNDAMDDDYDALDPFLAGASEIPTNPPNTQFALEQSVMSSATPYQIPLNLTPAYNGALTFYRGFPEAVDLFDNANQRAVASERMRSFTTPQDSSGSGRLMDFQKRPKSDNDFGIGYDTRGRTGYFRYYRPAGMPQEIRYPYPDPKYPMPTAQFNYPYQTNSGLGQQYLMPVLLPAGYSTNAATPASKSDRQTNPYHGFQSALTPYVGRAGTPPTEVVASMGAMPYDYDTNGNWGNQAMPAAGPGYPTGYAYTYNTATGVAVPHVINLLAPTIAPINPAAAPPFSLLNSTVNSSSWGPNLTFGYKDIKYILGYVPTEAAPVEASLPATVVNGYPGTPFIFANNASSIYLGGSSLSIDEADEMNLYYANLYDQPFGPSDLEWLYRLQDVDGSTLDSRLKNLAPVSFSNPADGLTRRRLFSTDTWELNRFAYANDNPGGALAYNSRFLPNASPSLEIMNQVVAGSNGFNPAYANPIPTEFLPNPTLPPTTINNNIANFIPNNSQVNSPIALPLALSPQNNSGNLFANAIATARTPNTPTALYDGPVIPFGNPSSFQVQTPSVAHGDRKINLNFPLPIANDPAEPIRQKWCRETYQLLKSILPPASIDTPEELAQLSQFVVNIVDYRDPDCTMTRFVNTDLEVRDVLTKAASNLQGDPLDLSWTVSPSGVQFATTPIPAGHFPYDPSIYSPDAVTSFLVQHGMENSPIAINEAMAYQATSTGAGAPSGKYQGFFLELVNTLTEEQNNGGTANASAISLEGWDIVVTPDDYGWGRPDPITGDVNPIALPPWTPNSTGSLILPPVPFYASGAPASQKVHANTTDPNLKNLYTQVQQFNITTADGNPIITAMTGTTYGKFVIGDYRDAAQNGDPSVNQSGLGAYRPATNDWTNASTTFETNPIVTTQGPNAGLNVRIPNTFTLPIPAIPNPTFTAFPPPSIPGRYYWAYLRRPANPFDTAPGNQVRPNKEMVVVDCMRFPAIDATGANSNDQIFSAQRMQPYRGGHLLRVNTPPPAPQLPTTGLARNVTTICPPSPPHAYGYSEQTSIPAPLGTTRGVGSTGAFYRQSINNTNGTVDVSWGHVPINDRDFNSVAELLLVPGCPPGLFTKQFIEEAYPGNIYANAAGTVTATGTDATDLTTANLATGFSNPFLYPYGNLPGTPPPPTRNPSLWGRQNFGPPSPPAATAPVTPAFPTYPYLTDNFYYSAASVAPLNAGNSVDPKYLSLTTEIGGWTGAGWHKMLEFFEVPSSANGAIGTADGGNNYDWARSDIKPGLINLNLIIDEEVFAGLMDDPRLNENLAYLTSSVPAVVTQIDGNGYPIWNPNNGYVYGQQTIFGDSTKNVLLDPTTNLSGTAILVTLPAGRGYTLRDPNLADYPSGSTTFPPQQVHGIKAAFCDFLKLRHGGSGYLFAFGNGQVGSGDYPTPPASATPLVFAYPVTLNAKSTPPFPAVPLTQATQPVAAERPYRSLSYPDINYTVLRPASLPPTRIVLDANSNQLQGTIPPLPGSNDTVPQYPYNVAPFVASPPPGVTIGAGLESLLQYAQSPVGAPYFVQFQPLLAPMNQALLGGSPPPSNYQYVFDPGLKNPFLPIQYVNKQSPQNLPAGSLPLAPPYATPSYPPTTVPAPVAPAPFPPPIPPTAARRLFQIADHGGITSGTYNSDANISNANLHGGYNNPTAAPQPFGSQFPVNEPTIPRQLTTGVGAVSPYSMGYGTPSVWTPPSLVPSTRPVFLQDNYTPQVRTAVNNLLGDGGGTDYRQHPLYRTEWLQKIMNLTTVRTHQFAVWITVGFFEVVRPGTPELGVPDVLGQELGLTAGKNIRYRSFFTLDRTKATGFNPYYPGNFRDCVTYRRRIE